MPIQPGDLIELLADRLKLNGSAETYRNFIHYQGYMVMIVLALAGSVLVGNDFRYGSLPFYLSKPLRRWHYLLGKGLAVAVVHQPDDDAAGPGPVRPVRPARLVGLFHAQRLSAARASSATARC